MILPGAAPVTALGDAGLGDWPEFILYCSLFHRRQEGQGGCMAKARIFFNFGFDGGVRSLAGESSVFSAKVAATGERVNESRVKPGD